MESFWRAPNKAFLVDDNGIVMARQGWFDGKSMQALIDPLLKAANKRDRDEDEKESEEFAVIEAKLKVAGFERYELIDAIRTSDPKTLEGILSKVPLTVKFVHDNDRGTVTTMLMEAVRSGNPKSIELLLKNGADINARTRTYDSGTTICRRTWATRDR